MKLVCLDLEGVLVPEIWIACADELGIHELKRTTRDEPDLNKLMAARLDILNKYNLKLQDIQRVISGLQPLEGALEFCSELRAKTQLIILSDTFDQFARPLMEKLRFPTLFCNTLEVTDSGTITGWKFRQPDGKKHIVEALASCNITVFAAGDSFNDLSMIRTAAAGCLFRAPDSIRTGNKDIACVDSYGALLSKINSFLS
jgi:phosphoserine/homoserine phosphotransferase